ncbi:extracellular solute-binding protein [Nakamurella silvestris]|nr:extracellular solute-binding protein [Nakamurella silvestris]
MRRTPVVAGLAAVSLLLAACGSDKNESSTPSSTPAPTTADSSAPVETTAGGSTDETSAPSTDATETGSTEAAGGAGGDVSVFTWWAAGSEKDGLDALVKVFGTEFPNDKFVNLAVAGGAGSNAKAKLASDLANNNPPDSFQGHAGAELSDYIKNGQIQPVDDVITELGGSATFPQDLLDRLTVDGHVYSIPSNIHRANVVWANPKVIKAAGIDPTVVPADIKAWIADLEKVKASGIETPLTIGGTWTQVQLLENVLLADLGAEGYSGLFDGKTDWASEGVTTAIADFATLLTYTNAAADGDDWPAAIDAVADGTAAYNVMGDWAVAEFNSKDKKDGVDYTYFPTPGTDGVFDFLADSFTLPVGAKNEGGAKDWLRTIGSAEGQKAFNLAKGSIPARSDAVAADYPAYQQTAIASWTKDTIVSSIAHGAAVNLAWGSDISSAVSKFYAGKDQATLQADLVTAAQNNAG